MRGKVAREIRNAMELRNGLDVLASPEYYIAQTKKRVVYVMNEETKAPEAKIVDRIVIVNKTKNLYRKVKKTMKAQRRNGQKAIAI